MAKSKRFTVHKKVLQDGRPNGKSWKQNPKAFDTAKGRLITVGDTMKGTSGEFLKS